MAWAFEKVANGNKAIVPVAGFLLSALCTAH
jgi:hypothetical protein